MNNNKYPRYPYEINLAVAKKLNLNNIIQVNYTVHYTDEAGEVCIFDPVKKWEDCMPISDKHGMCSVYADGGVTVFKFDDSMEAKADTLQEAICTYFLMMD